MTHSIPPNINTLDRLSAVQFYAGTLGWAIHPLLAPDRGEPQERGKKPILKGWRGHNASEITPDFLTKYFANGSTHNIGCVVRAPFVHVDLDSKPDAGASVMAWLATQPELAAVPRERTGGGAHLAFICRDIPEDVMKAKKAPTCQINDKVSAELYLDGLNLVLSPSVHKSGHTYSWEVTGDIPEVSWNNLCRWFGFAAPEAKKRGRPGKEKPWWSKWEQDLRTLDLAGVMEDLGGLGECLDPDHHKWSVRCPWEADHTGGVADAPGSDTIIFNQPETMPGFRCLHAHCESRGIKDLIEWAEAQKKGIITSRCANLRAWSPGTTNATGRPRIILPALGRSNSEFGKELGSAIAPALDLFLFSSNVVEIATVPAADTKGAIPGHMISTIRPTELVTAVERTVETGVLREDDAGDEVFVPKSMSEADARITLVSGFFSDCLPRIRRVLDVPVPHFSDDGKLIYPNPGYDERFGTWLNPHAPKLKTMGHSEALRWLLNDLFGLPENGGFWWHDEQARIHALARFITPFCRGLMGWKRTPLWIFDGNREGCGKDTCADLTHIAYTGRSIICAPLSKECDDEMRKRITSALMAGSRFFHLANMKGHVRYASLEAATDNSGVWEDRRLGVSETMTLPNETEFSFSANNATWEPDIERRCRRIRLRFTPDDINGHRYKYPDIKGWVRQHRADLLSAIAALVNEWVRQGCPPGPTPFTSFPEWGQIVGGILHCAGLPDPCRPHEDSHSSGDQSTKAMRDFFVLAFDHFGDQEVLKHEFQEFVQQDEGVHELFDWIDFAARRGQTMFGKLVVKFDKRELGGITFRLKQSSKNRATYRFFRNGEDNLPIRPSTPEPSMKSGGLGDFWGHSPITYIDEKNAHEKNKKESVLKALYKSDRETSPNVLKSPNGIFCSLRSDLDRIAIDLTGADRIALDIETYGQRKGDGLDPWKGDIRLLTLSRQGGTIWTIDLRATGYDLGPLKPILEEADIIAHNAKFDLLWLRVKCGLFAKRVLCTLTAARLLVAGTKPGNDLDKCLERYLGIAPASDHSRSDWASMLLTEDQLAYAARDVAHLHDLLGTMESELEASGLDTVWALECALLPCVVGMEATGIHVEREKLRKIADEALKLAQVAADNLRTALGNPSINPASPGQLLTALRAKGLKLESTAEEKLKESDDGLLVPLVLEFREASKRAQQSEALIDHIQQDGRIHGRFEPLGTATGRFSSKEPNLQNIGRGEIREAFTAPEGKRLIVADYSQIELRAAAAIAGETKMIEAYKAGADLHKLTAATVLGKPEHEVTKPDRQLAKAVNFGLIYGQSAPGLVRYAATSYGVTMDEDEATRIRQAFFRTYSRLRQWHGTSHNQAEEGITEVRTRTGRRRLIPSTASDWERFTAIVNTPVQGGTADGMKHALVLIHQRLPKSARIVSTVHDEVVVECREESAAECREIITTAMVEAMAALFPEVPVEVEANVCTTWAEK
jgi:DNA polymerase-1